MFAVLYNIKQLIYAMFELFTAQPGIWLALYIIKTCECIVLPTSTTSATTTTTPSASSNIAHLMDPSLDALIREIFVAATNNSADESTGEKPRIIRICAGLCVALDASCSRAEEVVEVVDGELVDNPDEYFDEGDGEFFDIRLSGDEINEIECIDGVEKCCVDETADQLMSLSIRPELIFGPVKYSSCGQRNVDTTIDRVISDGAASYDEFPWMVAILKRVPHRPNEFAYTCGGSLIHPSVVLTVAHCVHQVPANRLRVRGGERDIDPRATKMSAGRQEQMVRQVIVHDAFNASRSSLHNDIALLILDTPMQLANRIGSVCLPAAYTSYDRRRCVVSGWGGGGRAGDRRVLRKIQLPVVPRRKCERSLQSTRLGRKFRLHKSFICAGGEPGRDACSGDGGSPLVCLGRMPSRLGAHQHQRFVQVGIVAVGIGCGNHVPGVYVNVPEFRPWIDRQMQARGFAKSYYQT